MKNLKLLPKEALEALKDYVDVSNKKNKVECVADPRVHGTVAIQIQRESDTDGYTFHLLWSANYQDLEEVEFTSWPPKSGDLQF